MSLICNPDNHNSNHPGNRRHRSSIAERRQKRWAHRYQAVKLGSPSSVELDALASTRPSIPEPLIIHFSEGIHRRIGVEWEHIPLTASPRTSKPTPGPKPEPGLQPKTGTSWRERQGGGTTKKRCIHSPTPTRAPEDPGRVTAAVLGGRMCCCGKPRRSVGRNCHGQGPRRAPPQPRGLQGRDTQVLHGGEEGGGVAAQAQAPLPAAVEGGVRHGGHTLETGSIVGVHQHHHKDNHEAADGGDTRPAETQPRPDP